MKKNFAMLTLALTMVAGSAMAQPVSPPFCRAAPILDVPGTYIDFEDVSANDYFCPSIQWIAQRGVTIGCEMINGDPTRRNYCPDLATKRNQFAALLSRFSSWLLPKVCPVNSTVVFTVLSAGDPPVWTCGEPATPGPVGATGPQGPAGAQGPIGATGPQGPAGAQGPIGATGLQGLAGTNGTNGRNGVDGAQGIQGIQGLQGVPGTSGTMNVTVSDCVGGTTVQLPAGTQGEMRVVSFAPPPPLDMLSVLTATPNLNKCSVNGVEVKSNGNPSKATFVYHNSTWILVATVH